MTFFTFPLEQIGLFFRTLSLSGKIGNIIALILYTLLCLSPVLIYFYLRLKKRNVCIDNWLFVLSAAMFVVVYLMINPGCFPNMNMGGNIVICGAFYSMIVTYLIHKVLQ